MGRELRTCARLLSHESGAVRLLAVQQLLRVLRGATSTALSAQLLSPHLSEREACSALVNALLRACQRPAVENPSASLLEEHAATVDLASQCLGELGAVDPCRLAVTHKRILDDVMPGVATARPQRDEHAANPFSCDLSDTELCSNIIERFLIRTLQGAGEGPAVQATAYALMMLLQDVCHCGEATPALLPTWWAHRKVLQSGQGDDRAWKALSTEQKTALKLWAGLAEPTRHAVKPCLRLSYLTLSRTLRFH